MTGRRRSFVLAVFAFAVEGCAPTSRPGTTAPRDRVAPDAPRGVYSVTGDGRVTLYWSPPVDPDVAGYRILLSRDDVDYYAVADVPAWQRHGVVHGGLVPAHVPFAFVNGSTYYLGVEAYDAAGNRSQLTLGSTTFDTPRPAGFDLRLYDIRGPRFAESGYDFSRSPYGYALDGHSLFADIYYTRVDGIPRMRAAHPQVVEMQDKGFVDFDAASVGYLFEDEWRPASEVTLRPGHVVLLKLYEEARPGNAVEPFHVAKFRVVAIDEASVRIDWAYQIAPNNRELKPAGSWAAPAVPLREVRS